MTTEPWVPVEDVAKHLTEVVECVCAGGDDAHDEHGEGNK